MARQTIDIRSKGEVAKFLVELARRGQVRECRNLRLEKWGSGAHGVDCTKDWASRVNASNVQTDITGYGAPSSYTWPKCPADCPHFEQADNFLKSAGRDQYDDMEEKREAAKRGQITPMKGVTAIPAHAASAADREVVRIGKAIPFPEKITGEWLWKHVPMKFWMAGFGALLASVGLGTQLTRLSIVKEWMGYDQKPVATVPVATTATAVPTATTQSADTIKK